MSNRDSRTRIEKSVNHCITPLEVSKKKFVLDTVPYRGTVLQLKEHYYSIFWNVFGSTPNQTFYQINGEYIFRINVENALDNSFFELAKP